jgi:undecaprenyl-diphosphatase
MLEEVFLGFVQAATEFLPVSSSGHLALFSNLFYESNLFLITMLHVASLLAVLVFTRKEIADILKFNKKSYEMILYLVIATLPAVIFGLLFRGFIEDQFSSYLSLGFAFLFTGLILLSTKFFNVKSKMNRFNAFAMGLFQMLALFPGISRSGMTISAGLMLGVDKEKAAKFSFLLFIPLAIGAIILEFGKAYFSWGLVLGFLVCFIFSFIFLNLLYKIIRGGGFWLFGFYCLLISFISFMLCLN